MIKKNVTYTANSNSNLSCGAACLDTLGINENVESISYWDFEMVKMIEAAGYVTEQTRKPWDTAFNKITLGRFIAENEGTYLIQTQGHFILLQDGILTDTYGDGMRKQVKETWRIK